MDHDKAIRKEVIELLSHYFGDRIRTAFSDGYREETLPIYVHTAYLLLNEQIGTAKSHKELDHILQKHSMTSLDYE